MPTVNNFGHINNLLCLRPTQPVTRTGTGNNALSVKPMMVNWGNGMAARSIRDSSYPLSGQCVTGRNV